MGDSMYEGKFVDTLIVLRKILFLNYFQEVYTKDIKIFESS